MADSSWIAVDAMGGDKGLEVMMAGVAQARRRFEGMRFLLVGDESAIRASLKTHPNLTAQGLGHALGQGQMVLDQQDSHGSTLRNLVVMRRV